METTEKIFSGAPEAARSLADVLDARGIPCFVEDQTGFSVHTGASVVTHAWLLVAPGDVGRAELARSDWSAGASRRVRQTIRRIGAVVTMSLLPVSAWLVGALVLPDSVPAPSWPLAATLWFASLVAVGQLEDRRFRSERLSLPPGHGLS